MAEIDQIIERIEEDLNQIEAAQQLVKDAAGQVKTLKNSASDLFHRAETDFRTISEKHKELIDKMTQIAGKLEGFDFPDLKRDLKALDEQVKKQGQLTQEGVSALTKHLISLSTDLDHMEQALVVRLDSVRNGLQKEIQDQWVREQQWIEEKRLSEHQWMEEQWKASNQQVTQLQQALVDFRQSQEQGQRRQQVWLMVLTVLAVILLGLVVFSLLRAPVLPKEPERQETTGQVEERDAVPAEETASPITPPPAEIPVPELLSPAEAKNAIEAQAGNALNRIKSQSFPRLAEKYWDPEGVTFFPFGLTSSGRKFTLDELKTAPDDGQVYQWGSGPDGDPVALSFMDYFRQYVNQEDFYNAPSVHYNEITFPGRANLSAAAIARQFGPCLFVEYLVAERSLVLVFGEESKQVKGVVSGQ